MDKTAGNEIPRSYMCNLLVKYIDGQTEVVDVIQNLQDRGVVLKRCSCVKREREPNTSSLLVVAGSTGSAAVAAAGHTCLSGAVSGAETIAGKTSCNVEERLSVSSVRESYGRFGYYLYTRAAKRDGSQYKRRASGHAEEQPETADKSRRETADKTIVQ